MRKLDKNQVEIIRLKDLRREYKSLLNEARKEYASRKMYGMYARIDPEDEERVKNVIKFYSEEIRKIDKELDEILKKEKESL